MIVRPSFPTETSAVIPIGVIFCESNAAKDALNALVKNSAITSKSPQRLHFSFKQFLPFSQSPLQVNPGVIIFRVE
jgi:hypothetical protein